MIGLADSDLAMIRRFPLTHIEDEDHRDRAEGLIHALLREEPDEGGQADLDALADLVWADDQQNHDPGEVAPRDILAELIAAHQLPPNQLAAEVEIDPATFAALLAGTQPPTPDQAIKLGQRFHLDPSLFADKPEG